LENLNYFQKKGHGIRAAALSSVREALCSFHGAGAEAQQMADRAVLEHGRADRDKTYQAPIPDSTIISQEVHQRKYGQSDYDPHDPFWCRTYVLHHGSPSFFPDFLLLFLFYQNPLRSVT
jgi:hypothetical protein